LIALAAESSRQIRLSWAEVESTVAAMTPPEEARRDRSVSSMDADDRSDWLAVVDGELMAKADAFIPVSDDGLVRGDGAFDAFRVYDGRPFALGPHLDRLERSCEMLSLICPREAVEDDIAALLEASDSRDAIVRVILTRGGHRLCLLEAPGDPEELSSPATLLPVTYDPSTLLNGVKSLSYAANMMATRQAQQAGCDEALLVRSNGVVLEAPTSSIFWASGGVLRTPALHVGILSSITRGIIVDGIAVEQGVFPLTDLLDADEAFLASTGRGVQPVGRIGDTQLRSTPGPLTVQAQDVLSRAVQGSPPYRSRLDRAAEAADAER
jgi:branched-chain amino acid aminotransferase